MRKVRFSALGGFGGMGFVMVVVLFFELRARRVSSSRQVVDQLGMTVVGTLPNYKTTRKTPAGEQQLKEAIDGARTLLLHTSEAAGLKVVLIASPVSGEGKTSLACHLAASLTRAGRRTVLIDGDMRKPDAHRVFAAPPVPGLCEVLRSECPLGEALYETGLPGLRLLAAGQVDETALRSLARDGFANLVGELRSQTEFVIVDSSPILAVPDPLILAKHVDGVLFAVMQDETRMHRLSQATDKMSHVGARILGVVVNGTRDTEHSAYTQYSRYLKPTRQPVSK
jgi:capsular exopolysaccharide synthesis family protein